jgi:hypothetical protein
VYKAYVCMCAYDVFVYISVLNVQESSLVMHDIHAHACIKRMYAVYI